MTEAYLDIDELIKQNRDFAVYRIPGETHLHFVMQQEGKVKTVYHIEDLNNQTGFIIAPFQVSEELPIILIQGEKEIRPIKPQPVAQQTSTEINPVPNEAYKRHFQTFIQPLHTQELDKLVLSRSLTIDRKADFSPEETFQKACARYTRSYVYLCHTAETGTWLGSTPEILLSGKGNEWQTVALAGTKNLNKGELPTNWDAKNLKEQMLVVSYIRTQLSSLGIIPEESGPYTVRAGELAHLKSNFWFYLPDNHALGKVLSILHPTPAVCGLPKEKAYHFISENEGYNRLYYSGFIGWLNPSDKSDLYVNLRCMHIGEEQLTLYAGGGLLASS